MDYSFHRAPSGISSANTNFLRDNKCKYCNKEREVTFAMVLHRTYTNWYCIFIFPSSPVYYSCFQINWWRALKEEANSYYVDNLFGVKQIAVLKNKGGNGSASFISVIINP
jgi:hypothetical protein